MGTVYRQPGAPEHVWCGWQPRADCLLREVELTELCLRLHAARILRGPAIGKRAVRPDAEVRISGRLYDLHWHRATDNDARVARRLARGDGRAYRSLWVCATADHAESLRRRAGRGRETALFAGQAEALADPHGPIWRTPTGGNVSLPRDPGAPPAWTERRGIVRSSPASIAHPALRPIEPPCGRVTPLLPPVEVAWLRHDGPSYLSAAAERQRGVRPQA